MCSIEGEKITQEEKQRLVNNVVNAVQSDVLSREDMLEILRICREACERKIREIEHRIRPDGPVQ